VPELDEGMLTDDSGDPIIEEDAADRKERLRKQKDAEAAARLKLMSQPLQRSLPRPSHKTLKVHSDVSVAMSAVEKAGAMVEAEIAAIVTYEAGAYPIKGKPKKKEKLPPRDDFPREQLESAALMILEETTEEEAPNQKVDAETFSRVFEEVADDVVKMGEGGQHGALSEAGSDAAAAAALQAQFLSLRERVAKAAKKAEKAQKRAEILTAGLEARAKALLGGIGDCYYEIDESAASLGGFEAARAREKEALPRRLARLEAAVAEQVTREKTLQERFAELQREQQALLAGAASTSG
jgi:pre-mRNA-splicing factor CDC5/CEF1